MRTIYRSFALIMWLTLHLQLQLHSQTTPTDGDWKSNNVVLKNTMEAELMIRVGDIDNLGFGFPADFNPFSGRSTPVHQFPWQAAKSDIMGLDRIMIGSKFGKKTKPSQGGDGYSASNPMKATAVSVPLDALKGITVNSAILTMFVDDFQPTEFASKFMVFINGKRFGDLENILNNLRQGGPIGKFVTVKFPPEMLQQLGAPKLSVMIDDTSGAADGYAIDFIKLLVNPKALIYKNSISGWVKSKETDEPIVGAVVKVRGFGEVQTDQEGRFVINDLPIGLNVAEGSAAGYESNSAVYDVVADETPNEETIYLSKTRDVSFLGKNLRVGEAITLNNIQFAVASAELNNDAKSELDKVVALMLENSRIEIELSGHTSSEGSAATNTSLSQSRVQSCKNYLVSKGVDEGRINAIGYGPTRPIADNNTEDGRAKNRRVEMKVVKM